MNTTTYGPRQGSETGGFGLVDTSIHALKALAGATSGAFYPAHDPTGSAGRAGICAPRPAYISEGIVVQSRVGAFDCLCKVGEYQVACTMLSKNSNCSFGTADAALPEEGSRVLIYQPKIGDGTGWILGVINRGSYLDMHNQSIEIPLPRCYENALDAYHENAVYSVPEGDKDAFTLWASDNRVSDLLPGESAVKNENNCGYDITSYSMTITGGDSFIRVDRIDDEIRMRSTDYTRWSSHTAEREFNDGGLISSEGRNYVYQGEWLGNEGLAGEGSGTVPRPRTRWWKGFLGNIFSWFVVRPKKDPQKKNDDGLVSIHVSQAGQVMARAAGGVSIERYDAIPVPDRIKEPWDPEGDKETEAQHDALVGFNIGDDPHAVGLLKSSQMAYAQKLAYQRFDELKKDFKVQEEKDVKKPGNNDEDPFFSHELRLSEYQGRKAGLFIGEDGSVIIRDAWGSEIVMVGGNIYLNTQGSVVSSANGSIVSIAGQTVAMRGTKGADVTADNGCVHIQSKNVVEIAGGSDDTDGGVLIESLSKGSYVNAPAEAGDTAVVHGVVIKSEKAGVCLSGENTYVNALKNVIVTGGGTGDKRDGNVIIDGENTIITAAKTAGMIVETSSCLVTKDTALLGSSDGSALVAGHSAMIVNGDQIPILWDSMDEEVDLSKIKDFWDVLQDSNIVRPFDWDNLTDNAVFSFRTSSELGTDRGLSPWQQNGFKLYEPYWQVMKGMGVSTVVAEPVKPEAEKVHKSMCWPGSKAVESGKFVTVSAGDLNVAGENADSKTRESLKMSVELRERPMSSFTV